MFGIICNARRGHSLGIDILALVDRSRTKRLWWTSDSAKIAICYRSAAAAQFAAKRLKRNNARVVPFSRVERILNSQNGHIEEAEREAEHQHCLDAIEFGWDGHKNAG